MLSALHDGELGQGQQRALRARLKAEPELAKALDEISFVSDCLGAIRPELKPASPEGRQAGVKAALLAACIACAVVIGSSAIWFSADPSQTPLSQHQAFLLRDYPAELGTVPLPVSMVTTGAPDLTAANLRLVDIASPGGRDIYVHYAGRNGCRLTVGIHAEAPVLPHETLSLMVHSWSALGEHFSMVAEGMDLNKFEAIRVLLESWSTPAGPDDTTVLALQDATTSAVPCQTA